MKWKKQLYRQLIALEIFFFFLFDSLHIWWASSKWPDLTAYTNMELHTAMRRYTWKIQNQLNCHDEITEFLYQYYLWIGTIAKKKQLNIKHTRKNDTSNTILIRYWHYIFIIHLVVFGVNFFAMLWEIQFAKGRRKKINICPSCWVCKVKTMLMIDGPITYAMYNFFFLSYSFLFLFLSIVHSIICPTTTKISWCIYTFNLVDWLIPKYLLLLNTDLDEFFSK